MPSRYTGLIALGLLAVAGPAQATLMKLSFSGTTTAATILGAGATFSGSYTFDTLGPITSASYYTGGSYTNHNSFVGSSFNSGNFAATGTVLESSGNVLVRDDPAVRGDEDQVFFNQAAFQGQSRLSLFFFGPTTAISSSDIPTDLTNFYGRYVSITDDVGRGLNGIITSSSIEPFSASVPEPSAWAMMLTGFGLIGYAMRRRQRVSFAQV